MIDLNLASSPSYFTDADEARNLMEHLLWKNEPTCPRCASTTIYKLAARSESKHPVRKGVYKCKACRKQFTVTIGTVFEGSHIPLNKWLIAIYLLYSKKNVNAHQLHLELGITYKSARSMCQRIRTLIKKSDLPEKIWRLSTLNVSDQMQNFNRYQAKFVAEEFKYGIEATKATQIISSNVTYKELVFKTDGE